MLQAAQNAVVAARQARGQAAQHVLQQAVKQAVQQAALLLTQQANEQQERSGSSYMHGSSRLLLPRPAAPV